MKKFIKFILCLCLCVVAISFSACGKSKLECPDKDSVVTSNGGLAVQKGNFLYFANGYSSLENIKKSNATQKYTHGGLYFTKVDENGDYAMDDKGNTKEITRLNSRLAGFEATDLHIFGDYLYFTSINTEENKSGELQTKHLEIYRIKLDGTKLKRVYRSEIDFENESGDRQVEFTYFEQDNNVYILIKEDATLKRVVCSSKSIGKAVEVASDVLSIVSSESDASQIFYLIEKDDLYEIHRYNISLNKVTTQIIADRDCKIDSLFEVKFNNLYIYATFNSSSSYLYRLSLTDFEANRFNLNKLTSKDYTVYLLESELDGILLISKSKVEIAQYGKSFDDADYLKAQSNFSTDATIMTIKSGYVYYYKDKEIKRWNYTTDVEETIYTEENTICNYAFDIVGNYLYYYTTTGTNDYLYRVNIATTGENKASQLVGNFLPEDIPADEEEA